MALFAIKMTSFFFKHAPRTLYKHITISVGIYVQDFLYEVKRKKILICLFVCLFRGIKKEDHQMARVALVLVIAIALALSIHSVEATQNPAASPMTPSDDAQSQSWSDWFGE